MAINIQVERAIPGLESPLSEEEAQRLVASDPVLAAFVILKLSAEVNRLRNGIAIEPSSPPSATPVYKKPATKAGRKRKNKRGGKKGHKGHARSTPDRIDHRVAHSLERCPDCGGPVKPLKGKSATRKRYIEDIPAPEEIRSEVTEHTIHRCWCAKCKKAVEPRIADALPGCTLGHRSITSIAWLHYGLGIPLSKIREVLSTQFMMDISDGGIVKSAHRIADILTPWYDAIAEQVKKGGVVHADETGWRVLGKTHWLWCFTTPGATWYMIDRSRGSPALSKFFTESIDGVLVTDFWAAYNQVECASRQVCYPHLFREIDKVSQQDQSTEWAAFYKKLKRLMKDAIRLGKRDGLGDLKFDTLVGRLYQRLENLTQAALESENADVKRIGKRLKNHEANLFAFLDFDDVPSDNNRAEREIRPAVIQRKNINGNQSDRGAKTQAVLMTIFRTMKIRGKYPTEEIVKALRNYCINREIPSLPE